MTWDFRDMSIALSLDQCFQQYLKKKDHNDISIGQTKDL